MSGSILPEPAVQSYFPAEGRHSSVFVILYDGKSRCDELEGIVTREDVLSRYQADSVADW